MTTDRYARLFKQIKAAIDDRSKSDALLRKKLRV